MKTSALLLIARDGNLTLRTLGNTIPKGHRVLCPLFSDSTENQAMQILDKYDQDEQRNHRPSVYETTSRERYVDAVNFLSELAACQSIQEELLFRSRLAQGEFNDVIAGEVLLMVSGALAAEAMKVDFMKLLTAKEPANAVHDTDLMETLIQRNHTQSFTSLKHLARRFVQETN